MRKRIFSTLLLAGVLTVVLFSCKKKTEQYTGTEYARFYPLSLGHYVSYDVDSIIWDDFSCTVDTNRYQMRYDVADTFRDNQNRLSYRINISIRNSDTDEWAANDVIYATPTPTQLEVVQQNLRFEKLIGNIQDSATWLGNQMIPVNDQDYQIYFGWNYVYSKIGNTYNNGRATFDSTITVTQTDQTLNNPETMPSALANRTFSREVYAKDAGLVYREFIYWNYDPSFKPCRKGNGVIMRAYEHN